MLSPYQSNPLDVNPLRDLLREEIDFEAIAGHRELKVFVSATHVTTGKAVVFTGKQLNAKTAVSSRGKKSQCLFTQCHGADQAEIERAGVPGCSGLEVRHAQSDMVTSP